MSQKSLGIIETIGLTAAVEAADTALKSADVELVGYELSKGSGMTVVKVEGSVGAVQAAIDAAAMASAQVGTVVSTRVIPRPSQQIEVLVRNSDTVGFEPEPLVRNSDDGLEPEPLVRNSDDGLEPDIKPEAESQLQSDALAEEEADAVQSDDTGEVESDRTGPDLRQGSAAAQSVTAEASVSEALQPQRNREPEPGSYTCNLCRDPNCPRQKGDLKQLCIHYRKKKIG